MAPTYRTAGVWGAGKGADLTPAEVDTNFYGHDQRIDNLENNPVMPVEISNINVVGSQLTIALDDGTVYGPYTLPRARMAWRGDWAPSTAYFGNDIFRVAGTGVYMVNEAHTSGSVFDPDELDGSADDALYTLIFSLIPSVSEPETTSAGTYTPVLTDANAYLRFTDAGGTTFDVPDNATVAFPIGTEIHVRQATAGVISFVEGSTAVTINGVAGYANETAGQGAVVTLKKIATDAWDLFGLLALESTAT